MLKRTSLVSVLIIALVLFADSGLVKQTCFAKKVPEVLKYTELFANSYDCEFIDPKNGWIGGKAGILYVTKNGGMNWKLQDTGINESIFAISFINKDKGWAVGQSGAIISTADGGTTWVQQKSPVVDHLFCVEFTDPNHGVAAGDWGKIIFTEDGGMNWIDVSLTKDIILYDIHFINKTEGFIVAETGVFFHTVDGGKTWERQETDLKDVQLSDLDTDFSEEELDGIAEGISLFAISFDGKGNGTAVGLDGRVSYSSDNGKSWQTQAISKEALYNVVLVDGKGIAVGHAGVVFETRDCGKNWQKIDVPELMRQYWFLCLARLGEDEYIIAGAHGAMLFVKDSKVVRTSLE